MNSESTPATQFVLFGEEGVFMSRKPSIMNNVHAIANHTTRCNFGVMSLGSKQLTLEQVREGFDEVHE